MGRVEFPQSFCERFSPFPICEIEGMVSNVLVPLTFGPRVLDNLIPHVNNLVRTADWLACVNAAHVCVYSTLRSLECMRHAPMEQVERSNVKTTRRNEPTYYTSCSGLGRPTNTGRVCSCRGET